MKTPSDSDHAARVARLVGGASTPWRTLADILADPAAHAPPQVVVPHLAWAGRVVLLAAREKDGKSTLAASGAAAVTRGLPFLGAPTTPGPVLWVGVEEHPHDFAQRATLFGTDPERLVLLGATASPLDTLADAVAAVEPVLVVVDSLMTWAEQFVDDPHSASAWTPVMTGLATVARDSNAGLLVLHHSRKSDGKYRDSSAIGAGVDAILEMAPSKDDASVRVVQARGRWAMKGFSVKYRDDAFELLAGAEPSLDARILGHVEGHPGLPKVQLRAAVGGRATDVDRASDSLLARGLIVERPGPRGARCLFLPGAVPLELSGQGAGQGADLVPDPVPTLSRNDLAPDKVPTLSQSPTLGGGNGTRSCGVCGDPMQHYPNQPDGVEWNCRTCFPDVAEALEAAA